MHTLRLLQRFFRTSVLDIHSSRPAAVTVAANGGSRVAITAMGRSLHSDVRIKHRVKRMGRLKTLLPALCTPIIIADAGFRVPFFRYVQTLGWHWTGYLRAVCTPTDSWG